MLWSSFVPWSTPDWAKDIVSGFLPGPAARQDLPHVPSVCLPLSFMPQPGSLLIFALRLYFSDLISEALSLGFPLSAQSLKSLHQDVPRAQQWPDSFAVVYSTGILSTSPI